MRTEEKAKSMAARWRNADKRIGWRLGEPMPKRREENLIHKGLLSEVVRIHLASRPLSNLPVPKLWCRELKNSWVEGLCEGCEVISALMDAYDDTGKEEYLLEAILVYAGLPINVILPAARLKTKRGTFKVEVTAVRGIAEWETTIDLGGTRPPPPDGPPQPFEMREGPDAKGGADDQLAKKVVRHIMGGATGFGQKGAHLTRSCACEQGDGGAHEEHA